MNLRETTISTMSVMSLGTEILVLLRSGKGRGNASKRRISTPFVGSINLSWQNSEANRPEGEKVHPHRAA
ncbi:hypothetical protein AFLA_003665 [Aspergillus flavus NRRL3357]|nr:hypothetical protein AFLA_003665 [Aspergillus flavus NRRL3357]